jgi:hypothetical protein
MAPEEAEWAAVPYNYSVRTRRHHGERIAEDIAKRVENHTAPLTYLHQVANAELKCWPGVGQLYVTDEPRADRYIREFLERHTESRWWQQAA